MVNAPLGSAHPERALAIAYAPPSRRAAFAALLELDARLGAIVAAAREPIVGQMRLTWWHDALAALDEGPAPAEPLLRTLAAEVLPLDVSGRSLAGLVDGWERLLDPETLDLHAYAAERGGRLFALAATLLGASDADRHLAGEGWALADLACADHAGLGGSAAMLAREGLSGSQRWSKAGRALGALALSAAMDLGERPPGAPLRVARLLKMRLTGW